MFSTKVTLLGKKLIPREISRLREVECPLLLLPCRALEYELCSEKFKIATPSLVK